MTSDLKPPILLIGNVRSGTSMMHDLFDAHPDIKGWSEPRTVWMFADPGRNHDRFDASDASERTRRYIRRRFLQYQRQHGDLRVMEKTPSNVLRIPYVHAIFPESKLLYIVRDPLANLSSTDLKWNDRPINRRRTMQRLRETPRSQLPWYLGQYVKDLYRVKVLRHDRVSIWGVRYPGIHDDLKRLSHEEIIATQWLKCVEQAEADLAALPPDLALRIRYEDFVAQPVDTFESICAHVGVRMTSEFAEHVRSTVDPTRKTKWQRLSPDVLRRCVPIFRSAMERLGYTLPDEIAAMLRERNASADE